VNDWPVGFLCSALHSLGHNQLGTGGFRGFVHAENDSMVQLKEYFPGGHSAPLDDQENLETICEYLFTAVPAAMSLLMVGPALTWYFTGSWFLALLAFAIIVLFVFWFLNSF
jgi:ABC-type transport system involved in Fe-S cluster assembly fused permease/ATPase subunit